MPDEDSTDYKAGYRDAEFLLLKAQVEKLEIEVKKGFAEQHKETELIKKLFWMIGGAFIVIQALFQLAIPLIGDHH